MDTCKILKLSFGIEVPDVESLGPLVAQAIEGKVQAMEQSQTELYKNVFGLIVLGRFIPQGGGLAGGGGSGGGGPERQLTIRLIIVLVSCLPAS